MTATNYQHRFTVHTTPEQVFEAINRVSDWWTINTEGRTKAVGDEFTVEFGDAHRTTQRITGAVPGKRIVWQVIASLLPWLKDVEEWKGTEIIFEISATPEGAQLAFTHIGLTPDVECFEQCQKGWDYFIGTSLFKLITEGAGLPDTTQRSHMDTIGHVHAPNT
ncbi:MAG: SRPBCC domain-containing protein [Flavobacteriales bacterium]|nr:SRPBCC domain-containing protein [Flavobacteriales bacterium]MBP6696360.1 SRPBCC domain-containing protein [Flavobacteriales bacterium]